MLIYCIILIYNNLTFLKWTCVAAFVAKTSTNLKDSLELFHNVDIRTVINVLKKSFKKEKIYLFAQSISNVTLTKSIPYLQKRKLVITKEFCHYQCLKRYQVAKYNKKQAKYCNEKISRWYKKFINDLLRTSKAKRVCLFIGSRNYLLSLCTIWSS